MLTVASVYSGFMINGPCRIPVDINKTKIISSGYKG